MPLYLILLGGPGAGKGTQAQALCAEFGVPQVSSGDLFRENLKRATPLGQLARQYMDKGELVPDGVTIDMVRARLSLPDAQPGALLDGFPRTVAQAEALDDLLKEFGGGVNAVLYVKVAEQTLLDRLSGRWTCRGAVQHTYHLVFNPPQQAGRCDADGAELYQRPDDTAEVQANRIKVFFAQTAPLIAFYQQRGQLAEVDGAQSIPAVGAALSAAVRASLGQA